MIYDFMVKFLAGTWHLSLEMSPFLLMGFVVAGLLSTFLPPGLIARFMGGETVWSVVRASLIGIPLPLCSCGVLPVAVSARQSGAGKGPTLSFLITTPVTGIDSIIATAGVLGIVFTIARIIASFVLGLAAGIISILSPDREKPPEETAGACESCELGGAEKKVGGKIRRAFVHAFSELPQSMGNSLIVGLLVGGLITALVPEDLFGRSMNTSLLGILIAVLIGIPLYVCATGSIPIAAAMMLKGFTPGAALAFLIAGPATNAVAIATVRKILGVKSLIIYLATIFFGAIGFALLLDLIPFNFDFTATANAHRMMHHSPIYHLSFYALVLALAVGKIRPWLKSRKFKEAEKMAENNHTLTLKVPDMTCVHCEQTIGNALKNLDRVEAVDIDLKNKKVMVRTKPDADPEKILETVKNLGYSPELLK